MAKKKDPFCFENCFSHDREKMIDRLLILRGRIRSLLSEYGFALGPIARREYSSLLDSIKKQLEVMDYVE